MLRELTTCITYNPVSVTEDESLESMASMLSQVDFHHWPVVNGDHQLVGLVSEVDIVSAIQERAAFAEFSEDVASETLLCDCKRRH